MAMNTPLRVGQFYRSKLQPSVVLEVVDVAETMPYCTGIWESRVILKDQHGKAYHASKTQLLHYYVLASIKSESVPKAPYPMPHPSFETEVG